MNIDEHNLMTTIAVTGAQHESVSEQAQRGHKASRMIYSGLMHCAQLTVGDALAQQRNCGAHYNQDLCASTSEQQVTT